MKVPKKKKQTQLKLKVTTRVDGKKVLETNKLGSPLSHSPSISLPSTVIMSEAEGTNSDDEKSDS